MPALTINVSQSGLELRDVVARVSNRRGLMEALGREGANLVKDNFRQLAGKGNKQGWPSAHFWEEAYRSTGFALQGDSLVSVNINKVGVRLRYLGGEVHPVTKKWLTFPACPEAYGKAATEFPNLWLLMKRGVGPIALVRPIGGFKASSRKKARATPANPAAPPQKNIIWCGGGAGGGKSDRFEVMYWLRKSSKHRADPSVLPDLNRFATAIRQRAVSYSNSEFLRQSRN